MIDLREAVYYEYIDDIVVEIFDEYKWGLRRLGVDFCQELLETIVYCPQNLESTFSFEFNLLCDRYRILQSILLNKSSVLTMWEKRVRKDQG